MNLTRKAVVLAAGAGTRMRSATNGPAADSVQGPGWNAGSSVDSAAESLTGEQAKAASQGAKAMMPLGGRPFLDYSLSALADAGIQDVCLVVPPQHDSIEEHYRSVQPKRLNIEFAIQEAPKGTAHALLSAEAFTAGDEFLLLNGDNHYPAPVLSRMCLTPGSALAAFSAESLLDSDLPLKDRDARLRAFAGLAFDSSGHLSNITEKPDITPTWVSMNCWKLGPRIFDACRNIEISVRGELELPSAVLYSIHHQGIPFTAVQARGPVLDLSRQSDIPLVQSRLDQLEVRL